jgi:ubiquinone/menaquinone biosynthesis C-methylase UbiE
MPDLNTPLHLRMLSDFKQRHPNHMYGLHWGDPDYVPPLRFVKNRYVLPYGKPDDVAVEIGPGGGRWTRYLLGFNRLYAVDYHQDLLNELRRGFKQPNIVCIKNNGTDFPEIMDGEVNYLFSFGTFVHFDLPLIKSYILNMKRILKPNANAVIQYSDKTKIMAQTLPGFSDNNPEKMRNLLDECGMKILEEDLTTLWHSSLVRFTI